MLLENVFVNYARINFCLFFYVFFLLVSGVCSDCGTTWTLFYSTCYRLGKFCKISEEVWPCLEGKHMLGHSVLQTLAVFRC